MEQKKYTILWLDDQHEKMKPFKLQAKQLGIELICFKSVDGLDELEKNYKIFDGILLDAKFFERESDQSGAESIKALAKAKERIIQLPKKFNPFVLTGQLKLYNDDTFNLLFPNYYRKGNDDDVTQLFADLIREAENLEDTQIKHSHGDVFEVFTLGYLPREIGTQVLDLVKYPLPTTRVELKGMLVNIRSIHESCFVKLEEIDVISDSEAPLSDIVRHLSGNKTKENNYEPTTQEYQNDAIENLHKWVYYTSGKYIHNLKNENYNGYMISPYAVESLRSGILELLLWFKQTYKENS
jgi:hypothetical protein